jgi:hypothetical protein
VKCRKTQERFASLAEGLDLLSHVPFPFETEPRKNRTMPAPEYLKEHLCRADQLHLEGCFNCEEYLIRVAEMLELGEWYVSYALPPYSSY